MLNPDSINAMVAEHWPESDVICEQISASSALASIEVGKPDLRPGGYIGGPTLFAAADAALWFLAATVRGRPEPMALTSDLAIRYLAPAIGRRVFARASLNKGAGRSMVGTVSIWTDDNEDSPCATAQGAYILPARGESV